VKWEHAHYMLHTESGLQLKIAKSEEIYVVHDLNSHLALNISTDVPCVLRWQSFHEPLAPLNPIAGVFPLFLPTGRAQEKNLLQTHLSILSDSFVSFQLN
jgi:hypothetical protein